MSPSKIKIIFNDDGHDTYNLGGELLHPDTTPTTVADVEAALKENGFSVSRVPLKKIEDLGRFTEEISEPGAFIFNLCEGALCKSAFEMHVAALLELYGARFTGNGPLTLGLARGQGLHKDILYRRGGPPPRHRPHFGAPHKT